MALRDPQYALKDKGLIDSGCSRHMIGNMSYLSDFQDLNGGYVAFGGNPKGGKISDFKLPDESQVLLRVPRENNMYNVNLKDIVPSGNLTCRFAKATTDESNLWHKRLGHVNFKTINKLVKGTGPTWLFDIDSLTRTMNYQPVTTRDQSNPSAGFQEEFDAGKAGEEANQQYMLFPMWSTGSLNPQNKEGDATFNEKEHDAEKPESAVNLSPRSSALSGEQDDMTKKKDKGKSLVEYFTENRDLNADFEDYFEDNSNNVSAAGPMVPTAGQNYSNNTNRISTGGPIVPTAGKNYSNSTNPISAVGPLNSNTSPTHGKSSLRDAYQPPKMLEMEDIAYSDNENVGAEAEFNNLETSIIVSPIPTTRTHKDHPVSRVIKDQGGLLQIFNDDFHTCMFACFLSQEEPKRVHQALKDPSWIEAMQEELLQFKMQKVWILVDLPHGKGPIGEILSLKMKKELTAYQLKSSLNNLHSW
nr:ribonuclease H-like domain-containing protein [Tanacetum cinerariifolium]